MKVEKAEETISQMTLQQIKPISQYLKSQIKQFYDIDVMFAIACLGDDRKDSNDFSTTLERIDTELEIIREARAAAAGRLRTTVALELSPGSMWAAGRLGLRDLGNSLRPYQ